MLFDDDSIVRTRDFSAWAQRLVERPGVPSTDTRKLDNILGCHNTCGGLLGKTLPRRRKFQPILKLNGCLEDLHED